MDAYDEMKAREETAARNALMRKYGVTEEDRAEPEMFRFRSVPRVQRQADEILAGRDDGEGEAS